MKHFADLLLNKNNSKSNDQVPFIQRKRGIEIKSSREINLMKKSSRIVGTVLREINDLIKPGMSTKDLDDFAEKRIREMGAVPSFKGYHGFPSSICSSINNEVVHGIPNKNKIIDDFIFSIDSANPSARCLLYTSPSPRDATLYRMPSSA